VFVVLSKPSVCSAVDVIDTKFADNHRIFKVSLPFWQSRICCSE
jgi:hypothetical protein